MPTGAVRNQPESGAHQHRIDPSGRSGQASYLRDLLIFRPFEVTDDRSEKDVFKRQLLLELGSPP